MKILMIIAKTQYHNIEYGTPKKIFEEAGFEVVTASKTIGTCTGKLGGTAEATISIDDLDVSNYDAIVFIGGRGAREYIHDVQAHLTAQEALNRNKLVAAICVAPLILAHAGVLEGKKATVHNKDPENLRELEKHKAIFTGETVTVDGKIITANGPDAAEEFANKIVGMLGK